ncbi:MAG: hypothetical protein WBJ81_04825 [Rickettsiales bacterium]
MKLKKLIILVTIFNTVIFNYVESIADVGAAKSAIAQRRQAANKKRDIARIQQQIQELRNRANQFDSSISQKSTDRLHEERHKFGSLDIDPNDPNLTGKIFSSQNSKKKNRILSKPEVLSLSTGVAIEYEVQRYKKLNYEATK